MPTKEELERGIPKLLNINDEYALIEMRTSKVVADNPAMHALNKKASELLNSLPPLDAPPEMTTDNKEQSQEPR